MEDVIFAGTSGRAPLGRAEVTLTIDNSDGALPIDYTEVSITRRMFRDGAGEYEINGTRAGCSTSRSCSRTPGSAGSCTSSSGRASSTRAAVAPGGPPRLHRGGRGRPQAPQAQGEGAAQARRDAGQPDPAHGPHRRAAPPAQAAGPAGGDRAAGPGRPVRAARRPAAAGRRRPGRAARRELAREEADEAAARRRAARGRGAAGGRPRRAGAAGGGAGPGRAAARRRAGHLVPALDAGRAAAGHRRPGPRSARHLADTGDTRAPGRDPDELEAEAEIVAEQEAELASRGRRGPAAAGRGAGGTRRARGDARRRGARPPRRGPGAGRPPGRAGDAGRPGEALRSGVSANAEEIERLSEALAEADERTQEAQEELEAAREETGVDAEGTTAWASGAEASQAHDAGAGAGAGAGGGRAAAEQQRRTGGRGSRRCRSGWAPRRVGHPARRRRRGRRLGRVASCSTVEPGGATAVAAALGELADAVAVDSPDAAVGALRQLRSADAGRATLLVGGRRGRRRPPRPAPRGGRWAADLVRARRRWPGGAAGAAGVVVVDDLEAARTGRGRGGFTAVTVRGDLLAPERPPADRARRRARWTCRPRWTRRSPPATAWRRAGRLRPALEGARAEGRHGWPT